MLICVLDVGGGHISRAVYDLETSGLRELDIVHFAPNSGGASSPLALLQRTAREASHSLGAEFRGISVAMPNPFDYSAGVSWMKHKLSDLYGVNLRLLLAETTGLPSGAFEFVNDADAFLLGALAHEAKPRARSIGITLGTGIGSAFSIDFEIVIGGPGVPEGGEIWNLPFGAGTIEDAISTGALVAGYRQETGKEWSVPAIAQAAREGDPSARKVFERFAVDLAQVLNRLCAEFPAEQILLGGGLCGAADLFLATAEDNLQNCGRVVVVSDRAGAPLTGAGIAWRRARQAILFPRNASGQSSFDEMDK